MEIEVAKHGITPPAAKNLDAVGVNATEEECHGTTRLKGASSNVGRVNTSVAGYGQCSSTEQAGNHGTGDSTLGASLVIVHMKRRCEGSMVLTKVCNAM